MDLQTLMNNAVNAQRAEEFKNSNRLSLGELILKLEAIQSVNKDLDKKDETQVCFDFCGMAPTILLSWRGVYAELALGYEREYPYPTISNVIRELKSGVGKTYEGYKGGSFAMGRSTPVWVDNWGQSSQTAIIDVLDNKYYAVLITGYQKD